MKVLKGSLVETLYEWPDDVEENSPVVVIDDDSKTTDKAKDDHDYHPHSLAIKKVTTLKLGQVAYMSDKLGLHKMSNPNSNEVAVSLHLYTPPYASKFGCQTFDESTGKSTKVSMTTLYSNKGVILDQQKACSC